ncbi:2-phosphosulfolactate phosphatase [Lysobacter aestuarii]|uniref:Probable 2-phosphosulfolactate phosphatase n=2 Tax=Marilutibacter aestuarii TaxID=1706195 RepID=A0A507ZXE4_9GAMM|nr:2-phosphosulfolactate phosphatase [Lysobacter aestuarii]
MELMDRPTSGATGAQAKRGPMRKLHVLFKREELDPTRLAGKVVIVLDVLFATSTIVHAFGQGIRHVWPARDASDALRIAGSLDAPLLAGEYLARGLPGFGPATPLALATAGLHGATLVYATTNGTVALGDAAGAAHVYVGALLNGRALVEHVVREHPDASVLVVCAGSANRFNLEDFYGAGHLASHFEALGDYALTDAAIAALLLYRGCAAGTALGASRVGRLMRDNDHQAEVDCAARMDCLDVVPRLQDGCLQLVAA